MSRSNYKLPPMTMLMSFETAARLSGFKQAASELGVTPSAVSHQVKALEHELDTPLFIRKHRGIELTAAGLELFTSLEHAFTDMGSALQHIRSQNLSKPVLVGSTTAVSSLWITPALMQFGRNNSSVIVNQLVSDTRFAGNEALDLYISYGRDEREGLEQSVLYRDTLVPVCAPELAARIQGGSGAEAGGIDLQTIAAQKLIHLEAQDRNWTSWQSWFQTLGYAGDIASTMRVNNYMIALQAAQDNAGILLGWKHLIEPFLTSGQLTLLSQWSVPAPHRFFLVTQPANRLSSQSKVLRDWLLDALQKKAINTEST